MPVLALDNLTARFGDTPVLGPLSIELQANERVALVGKSGAGKSTLLSLLMQHSRLPTAWVPQELGLVQTLSVFHNVYMAHLDRHSSWYNLTNLVWPRRQERERIAPVLAQLQLTEKEREPVGELSGGQKQRTAVARALYQQADLLLADEPVSALDGPLAHVVMESLSKAYPTSVIALHDIDLALRYSDRIVGIQNGQIALDRPTHRVHPDDLQPLYES